MDEDIRGKLEDHEKRITKLEQLYHARPVVAEKRMSINEFVLSKRTKSAVQKVLVIGYYLEKHQGLHSFNVKDLEDGFSRIKESLPDNINDAVNKNIRKGHMSEAEEPKDSMKAWRLTATGESFVEHDLISE